MTPTIEEVKNVAVMCGFGSSDPQYDHIPSYEELQAFAQHYKEEGRKEQRESDAYLIARTDMQKLSPEWKQFLLPIVTGYEKAIRNNMGE